MQLSSRWLSAIGAAMICVVMCLAVDDVAAQSAQNAQNAQRVETAGNSSPPAPPIVLNLEGAISATDTNVGDPSPSVLQTGMQTGMQTVVQTAFETATPKPANLSGDSSASKQPAMKRLAKNNVVAKHAKSSKRSKSSKNKQGWVAPLAIVSQLKTLLKIPVTEHWATDVQRLITMLQEESTVSSPGSAAILMQLDVKVQELDQIVAIIQQQFAGMPTADSLTSKLRRLRYDLAKRTVIWRTIQKLPAATRNVSDVQLASNQRLTFDYLQPDWQEYLQIEQLQGAFESLKPVPAQRKKASRLTLARMASPSLSDSQRNYINQTIPASVVSALKHSAAGDVNQYQLLKAIEWNEQNPSGVATHFINDQFQNLMWSTESDRQDAATQLQAHYRNANVRLAVSQNMLNRLIPDSPAVNEPVREQVLGADISGHSQIRNRLSVKLVDDPSRIALQLQTDGEVDSDTIAKRSGFEIRNEGMAKFQVFKKFTLDRMGRFASDSPVATAQAKQRLIGMRSKLDPFPVVNWIAHRVAKKKLAQQSPTATLMLEQKIRQSASHKLQQGVESQVAQMQAYLKVNLLEPLISMDLNPEALQLATTRNRIVMRYRLAGIDQMASDSPRPADSPYDYLSLQLHQSLLNNTIERIEIESQTFTPESLLQHLSEVIGFNPKNAQNDSKHEAKFVFANYDAIRVDFVDGKIRIELNLKSLRVGKGKTWRNITISSTYVPTIIGSQIQLTQEGMIGVKGKRFRIGDQIAVRAIFNVVLPDSYQFDTVPQRLVSRMKGYALVISKINIADGWVGLTYDEVPRGYAEEFPPIYQANGQGMISSDQAY